MATKANDFLEEGGGVVRLKPTWVPRSFCRPGKRIKLHPDDYYVLGLERGGIDERWLASTTHAANGGAEPDDEGMSYVVSKDGTQTMLLKDMVEELRGALIGEALWGKYKAWPMFSKFFDNAGPLPHHVHHRTQHAARVQQNGKPEMYFFPAQMNPHGGEFPFTFFGLTPETSKEEMLQCLKDFAAGDNKLLDRSFAYKLTLDTGWNVPPGVLHAPGSLCTYEPQFASDVYAMYQSVLYNGQCVPEDLLWKDCPAEEQGNFNYLLDVLDWEKNTDAMFHERNFMRPMNTQTEEEVQAAGYRSQWICYKCAQVCAKRLTVLPGRTVTVKEAAAYGMICLQGAGTFGDHPLETPALIRYGALTNDEFFVSEAAARRGVEITNASATEEIVILQHFAENPERDAL